MDDPIDNIKKQLYEMGVVYEPSKLELYCFERACKLIEQHGFQPADCPQSSLEELVIQSAERLLETCLYYKNNGYQKININYEYLGLTDKYINYLRNNDLL